MSQYFEIHPTHPQLRLVHQAVEIIDAGGVVAYPTDSSYALGCHIGRVVEPNEDGEVNYSNQIARILQDRCVDGPEKGCGRRRPHAS